MEISKITKEKIKKGEMLDVHEVAEALQNLDTYAFLNRAPIVSFFKLDDEWYSLEHGGDISYAGVDVVWQQKAKKYKKAPDGFGPLK